MTSSIVVRKAVKEDFPDILNMIQELAYFEKMPDGPTLKLEDLLRDGGFDESKQTPLFFCFIAESKEHQQENNDTSSQPLTRKTVGYSLCFYTYSTWQGRTMFMEDIYVRPEFRGCGVGKLIFNEIVRCAKANGCLRLDFHVLNWNPATDFYKRRGAIDLTGLEEWHFYRLQLEKD